MKAKDITGQRFEMLTVLGRAPNRPHDTNAYWHCKCDCGNVKIYTANQLGKTVKSCGCLAEQLKRRSFVVGNKKVSAANRAWFFRHCMLTPAKQAAIIGNNES